jgi:phosphate transporter
MVNHRNSNFVVGGMASPIASPQNAIAMGIINPPPSWSQWFLIAIPVCILLDFCIWGILLLFFRPQEVASPPEISSHNSTSWQWKQYYVIGISVLTIFLWCIENTIEGWVGDMGVIAIVPIVAFYGFGILTKDDWNSMLWSGII